MLSKKTWRVRIALYTLTGAFMMQPFLWNAGTRKLEKAPAWMQFIHYAMLVADFCVRAWCIGIGSYNVLTRPVPFPVIVGSLVVLVPQFQSVLSQITLFFLRDLIVNMENGAVRFNRQMRKRYKLHEDTPDGLERMSMLAAWTGLVFCCGSPLIGLIGCYVDETKELLHGFRSETSLERNVLLAALFGFTTAIDAAQLFVWMGSIVHVNATRLWLERMK